MFIPDPDLGFFPIPDPDLGFFPIPDPMVKKAPDPGSPIRSTKEISGQIFCSLRALRLPE